MIVLVLVNPMSSPEKTNSFQVRYKQVVSLEQLESTSLKYPTS